MNKNSSRNHWKDVWVCTGYNATDNKTCYLYENKDFTFRLLFWVKQKHAFIFVLYLPDFNSYYFMFIFRKIRWGFEF